MLRVPVKRHYHVNFYGWLTEDKTRQGVSRIAIIEIVLVFTILDVFTTYQMRVPETCTHIIEKTCELSFQVSITF